MTETRGTSDAGKPAPPWRSIVEVGQVLFAAGLVTSHGGNVSLRRAGGGALITATGTMLGRLEERDLVQVHAGGRADDGHGPAPSSDTAIHLAVYSMCRDAGAVIHAHPVHGIALSYDWEMIEPQNLEGRVMLGRVPVLDVEWEASAQPIARALVDHPVVIARGHGAYARGADVWEALKVTSALEEAAHIIYLRARR